MVKLKPVVIQKASEEGTRGEAQSPFGNIFHGKRFAVRGAPIDKGLFLQQPLRN
jgi:hypothetical protein